jgi:hypothetical protein
MGRFSNPQLRREITALHRLIRSSYRVFSTEDEALGALADAA